MKVLKLESLLVDTQAEKEGQWVPSLNFSLKGVKWKLRSTNYEPYVKDRASALEALAKEHGNDYTLTDEDASRVTGGAVARHLLLGWEGIDEAWSVDTALRYLTAPSGREILRDILASSTQVGKREIEFLEVAAKNSETPSALA